MVQGTDLNGDGVNNDRPLFCGRNDATGYGFKEVNLRVSRTFRYRERYSLEAFSFKDIDKFLWSEGGEWPLVTRE